MFPLNDRIFLYFVAMPNSKFSVHFQSAAFSLRHANIFLKYGANAMMEVMKVPLSVTKTVGQLLFDGYSDPFLSFVKKFPVKNLPPFSKFGWFLV